VSTPENSKLVSSTDILCGVYLREIFYHQKVFETPNAWITSFSALCACCCPISVVMGRYIYELTSLLFEVKMFINVSAKII